ncbi:1-phosphofructokinase [Microbacterium sp. NPDC056003]|uniref:1-phosphofructokinase n=1 Tax=Microbacterium sp. NPDC056003 TaxID=3345676 RepID=UPI0035E2BF6A
MIVTLTVNPSLDRTIELDQPLRPGGVQGAVSAREDAGGKGINVARAVSSAGVDVVAVLPLAADDPFGAVLRRSSIVARTVAVDGHVRANVTITDPSGETTKLNLPGVALSEADAAAVVAAVVTASEGARWLVLAGSLPPGVRDDFYVDVIAAVRRAYGPNAPQIAVDTSGPALATVVERGRPDLIKPNDDELAELVGRPALPPGDPASIAGELARTLVPSRVAAALVTLGSAGAVLVTPEGAWSAAPPAIRVASTVGAGDSSLAGYVLADSLGAPAEERLRHAVRYGAAAASLPGTQAPSPADLPDGDVVVTHLSPA